MGSKIVKAGTSSGILSPVSQSQQNQSQIRPLGLLYNPDGSYPTDMPKLGGTLSQVSKPIKNSEKFNQILAAVQKRKTMRATTATCPHSFSTHHYTFPTAYTHHVIFKEIGEIWDD